MYLKLCVLFCFPPPPSSFLPLPFFNHLGSSPNIFHLICRGTLLSEDKQIRISLKQLILIISVFCISWQVFCQRSSPVQTSKYTFSALEMGWKSKMGWKHLWQFKWKICHFYFLFFYVNLHGSATHTKKTENLHRCHKTFWRHLHKCCLSAAITNSQPRGIGLLWVVVGTVTAVFPLPFSKEGAPPIKTPHLHCRQLHYFWTGI